MTGDPFRPLPTREDYAADLAADLRPDMAQADEPDTAEENGRLPKIILTAAIVLICAAAVWVM